MKLYLKILLGVSVVLGITGIVGIIADAMTSQDVVVGWIMLVMIILGIVGLIVFIVLYIVTNKEKIKNYFDKYK